MFSILEDRKIKNSLAIVDKRIRELEDELRKLKPEGETIEENTLILATKFLNERVRQHGYSAKELLFRRKQETLAEIDIKCSELKEKSMHQEKIVISLVQNSKLPRSPL